MLYMFWTVWLAPLLPMFFGIGMGPTSQQKAGQAQLAGLATFDTTKGENATNKAENFWSSIMSGDMNKIFSVLGPQIEAIQGQGQQAKQTASQFSNRSGGTNAYMQTADDRVRAQVNNLISNLTGQAANAETGIGLNLLNQGREAGVANFDAASVIQKLQSQKWGDIFGSIADIAGGFAGMPGIKNTTTGRVLTGIGGMIGG